jgi:chromate transporter
MTDRPRPNLWQLFTTFLIIGTQSFGGGSSTFLLIHRACINRGWLTDDEFVRDWALSQISPGINLIKITVMVGNVLRGWQGVVAAMAGLLFPSAGATALMTAGFSVIRNQPLVQAALKGILPATIGLSLAMAVQMAQPLFKRAYQEGRLRLIGQIVITAAAALMMAFTSLSPVLVMLMAGAGTAFFIAATPLDSNSPARTEAP